MSELSLEILDVLDHVTPLEPLHLLLREEYDLSRPISRECREVVPPLRIRVLPILQEKESERYDRPRRPHLFENAILDQDFDHRRVLFGIGHSQEHLLGDEGHQLISLDVIRGSHLAVVVFSWDGVHVNLVKPATDRFVPLEHALQVLEVAVTYVSGC